MCSANILGWPNADDANLVQKRIMINKTLNEFHFPNVAKMKKKNFSAWRKLKKEVTSVEEVENKSRAACKIYQWAETVEEIYGLMFLPEYQIYKEKKFGAVVTEPNNKLRKLRAHIEKVTVNKLSADIAMGLMTKLDPTLLDKDAPDGEE
jgi:hypothetical protein